LSCSGKEDYEDIETGAIWQGFHKQHWPDDGSVSDMIMAFMPTIFY
jgi:hypothetical protein